MTKSLWQQPNHLTGVKERLEDELAELCALNQRLARLLTSNARADLPQTQDELLSVQYSLQNAYIAVLRARIRDLEVRQAQLVGEDS